MASPQPLDEETVHIDPSGDVLFIVGGYKPIIRLLVSSKILSLASPVFAAMFSPRFKEGSNLDSNSPSEVPLPEDDAEAMTLLCNCLHFRTDHIPRNTEYSSLKTLAILCDKYDAAKAISSWNVLWFRKWETLERKDGFEGLLLVIYALDCAEAFAEVSRTAILNQVGPFDTHKVPAGLDMAPHSPLGDLEAQRGAVQASLQKSIENIPTPILKLSCERKQKLVYVFLQLT